MASYQKTIEQFETILKCDMIDLKKLKTLAFNGYPAENGIRSLTWKILLNYLVLDRTKWSTHLSKHRELYRGYIRETIIKPGLISTSESNVFDHPLNSAPDSSWAVYFKENEVLLQIDKDVRRLCPDLSFFQRETEYPCSEILNQEIGFESLRKRIESTALKVESRIESRLTGRLELKHQNKTNHSLTTYDINEYQLLPDGHEAHWEVVERILFIFSKLNSGQSYVQGMNEIIGPIYYTFATDPNPEWRVLSALSKHNFQLKPVKCSIFHQQIAYLSHTISEHGVKRTNEKIQAIFKLRQPTKLAEANKFLGALSWYHDNYPVILTMDASEIGTGGTLQQNINGKIQNLYDHSQVTSSTQRRYDPIELEALAIWLCFQRMRSYLLGRSIIIYTDHCPLCKMMNSSVKNR
ncbi:unnamed protein product [Rotaria sordida]|uniref:Rab-GAP TBC domain-containing protein n=2 Tax=Rotaria sordida TaxID=392033 RepID=A0A819NJW9_9BILA|nr:unnamed protein product [Rotaria sordida]